MNWLMESFVSLWILIQIYWLEIIIWSIAVIFAFLLSRLFRRVLCRLLFVKKLKQVAKRNKIEFSMCRFPLTSLIFSSVSLDIKLKTPKESFNLFFCPKYMRKKNVYVFDDTKLYYTRVRAKSFWGNRNWGGSPSLVSIEETGKKEIMIALKDVEQGHNILIFEPKPIDIFVYRGNGYSKSGSGDMVGNLFIYESKDFLNYIFRNYSNPA